MVSFNGATSLILGFEFFSQGCHEFLVVNQFPNFPFPHSSLTAKSFKVNNPFPLVLTSAITLSLAALILSSRAGIDFYFVTPGLLISQHGPTAH